MPISTLNIRWTLAALVLFVAALGIWQIGRLTPPGPGFDSSKWLASKSHDRDSPRAALVADLQENYLKVGLGTEVVTRILGNPDKVHAPNYFGEDVELQRATTVWSYHIGAWSGFRVDMDYLAVAFDKDGKILMTWVWQS